MNMIKETLMILISIYSQKKIANILLLGVQQGTITVPPKGLILTLFTPKTFIVVP